MNILFLTPAFPPFPGGGERYAFSLANELIRRGHTITVLTSTAKVERDFWQTGTQSAQITRTSRPNLQIIRCPLKPLPFGRPTLLIWRKMMVLVSMLPGDQSNLLMKMAGYVPSIPALEQTLNNLDIPFDLVQAFNLSWEYALTAGWRYAKRHNLPLIVTPYTHLGVGSLDRVALNSTMDHQLKILTSADAVLTLTTIEEMGLANLGINPNHIKTIHGGLDPHSLPDDANNILDQLKISQPYVLYLGRTSFDKGAIHAAQAMVRFNQTNNDSLPLVLAGQSTPEFERLYQKLTQREKDWIRPLGIVTDEQKQVLLSQTEMLLLPSKTDSFGIVLLEAWGYARPVIGAIAGGIPGVIDHNINGLLVEFGDVPALTTAIQQLMDDPTQKDALGQAGLNKVNNVYSWKKVGERVEAVYRQIVQP